MRRKLTSRDMWSTIVWWKRWLLPVSDKHNRAMCMRMPIRLTRTACCNPPTVYASMSLHPYRSFVRVRKRVEDGSRSQRLPKRRGGVTLASKKMHATEVSASVRGVYHVLIQAVEAAWGISNELNRLKKIRLPNRTPRLVHAIRSLAEKGPSPQTALQVYYASQVFLSGVTDSVFNVIQHRASHERHWMVGNTLHLNTWRAPRVPTIATFIHENKTMWRRSQIILVKVSYQSSRTIGEPTSFPILELTLLSPKLRRRYSPSSSSSKGPSASNT
jgi:hypothetical protein